MLVGVKVAHFEANSWEAIKRGKKLRKIQVHLLW